jgi:hypothetical protein
MHQGKQSRESARLTAAVELAWLEPYEQWRDTAATEVWRAVTGTATPVSVVENAKTQRRISCFA